MQLLGFLPGSSTSPLTNPAPLPTVDSDKATAFLLRQLMDERTAGKQENNWVVI